MVKRKVVDNLTLQVVIFSILTKSLKCGLESQKCLAQYRPKSFLTKMVLLQSSIIKIFYALENSFFHHIFFISTCKKKLNRPGYCLYHQTQDCFTLSSVRKCQKMQFLFNKYKLIIYTSTYRQTYFLTPTCLTQYKRIILYTLYIEHYIMC